MPTEKMDAAYKHAERVALAMRDRTLKQAEVQKIMGQVTNIMIEMGVSITDFNTLLHEALEYHKDEQIGV